MGIRFDQLSQGEGGAATTQPVAVHPQHVVLVRVVPWPGGSGNVVELQMSNGSSIHVADSFDVVVKRLWPGKKRGWRRNVTEYTDGQF